MECKRAIADHVVIDSWGEVHELHSTVMEEFSSFVSYHARKTLVTSESVYCQGQDLFINGKYICSIVQQDEIVWRVSTNLITHQQYGTG